MSAVNDPQKPTKREATRPRQREMSTLAWVGHQLKSGTMERFPPRLPDGDEGDYADGAKVGGS